MIFPDYLPDSIITVVLQFVNQFSDNAALTNVNHIWGASGMPLGIRTSLYYALIKLHCWKW